MPPAQKTPSRIPLPSSPGRSPVTPRPGTAVGFGRFTPSLPLTRCNPIATMKTGYHTSNSPTRRALAPASPPSVPPRPKSRLDSLSSLVRSASRLGRPTHVPAPTRTPASVGHPARAVHSPMSPPVMVNLPPRTTSAHPLIIQRERAETRRDGPWASIHLEWAEYDGQLTWDQKLALEGAECLAIRDPFEDFNRAFTAHGMLRSSGQTTSTIPAWPKTGYTPSPASSLYCDGPSRSSTFAHPAF